jgi:hypothetical protein
MAGDHSPQPSVSHALELVEETLRLTTNAVALCDETRLTRAWSQELRRRGNHCEACHRPLAADGWFTVAYLRASQTLAEGRARVHPQCLGRGSLGACGRIRGTTPTDPGRPSGCPLGALPTRCFRHLLSELKSATTTSWSLGRCDRTPGSRPADICLHARSPPRRSLRRRLDAAHG